MQENYRSHIDSDHSVDNTPPQTTGNSRPQSEVFLHEKVLVAVDATKQLTKHALEWALTNVLVRPGESITLLALLPAGNYSKYLNTKVEILSTTRKFDLFFPVR